MYGDAINGIVTLTKALVIVCVLSVPLGLWTLIELALWLASHIAIHWH